MRSAILLLIFYFLSPHLAYCQTDKAEVWQLYRNTSDLMHSEINKRPSDFVPNLEAWTSNYPRFAMGWRDLCMAYINKKDFEKARIAATKAKDLGDNTADLDEAISYFELKPILHEATKRATANDFNGAIEEYLRALKVAPNRTETHLEIGAAYQSLGQLDKAKEHYDIAEQLNPSSKAKHLPLAK